MIDSPATSIDTETVTEIHESTIWHYIIRRALIAVLLVFLVLAFDFTLFRILPGDPITLMFSNMHLTHSQYLYLQQQFGFTKPLYVQFWLFLVNVFKGNFGVSYAFGLPVSQLIFPAIAHSLMLGIPAVTIAISMGILTGKLSAWKRGKKTDVVLTNISMILWSIPGYWLGLLMILAFLSVKGVPLSGMYTYGTDYVNVFGKIADLLRHMFLPMLTLSLVMWGSYTLIMRNSLVDVLTEDYIVTARAKGVAEYDILNKHAMPNAMLPMISMIAINIGFLVGGLLVIETVFSWPGIGWMIYQAIMGRDYPLMQGAFLVIAISVVCANFVADLIYLHMDPRIKYE